ncbi:hypothetical protein [Thermocatellispora tengchongensis]|uniref:hypothetical protein n=1 Tax=Thermocatellispora tengchongensis TaxID=1073253 RepID=UPI00362FF4A7
MANGADGIAVRDIAGSWQRLGVNGAGFEAASAVSLTAPGVYPDYVPRAAVLGALAAALLAVGCGVRRRTFFIGSVLAWTAVWSFYEIRNELFIPFNPFALGLGLVLVPVAGFFMIHGATLGRARFRTWAVGLATGVLCFYSIMTPFYAWSAHLLDYYALASGLAIGLGIATASAGAFAVIELDASGSPSPSAPAAP